MSELTKLQKISALSKDLMNKKMNDTDRFVHLSHIHELAEELQPELNKNQQVVLDWLKENVEQDNASPMCAVFLLGEWQTRIGSKELRSIDIAYCRLDSKQQAQVLQTFSRWAIEQEEE
ncbi:hypothetical protein [Enterococcus faecalis]|uniref:hypothetical protein n=1 Tax=Enterococcus faecalis TaxID=1351 RepID=UPI0035EC204F